MDTAKHLYDVSVLFNNDKIQKLLNDKDELNKLIYYKRQEEKVRIGGIDEETEIKDFTSTEEIVSKLCIEPPKVEVASKSTTKRYASSGSVNTATTTSRGKVNLGFSLIRPVSGTITSRFGASSNIRRSSHTGLDIAAPKGTPIAAAASGTVTFSGYKGSYGYMIVISHGNNIQTYYGHCSKLYVSAGTQVSQGQTIAAVGSTGNSTGPHLHLEIRVNGVAYNPQNYLY